MASIDELRIADEPESWRTLGFAVEGEVCEIGEVRLRLVGRQAGMGITGWSLRGLTSGELDGIATEIASGPPMARGECPPHANGVVALDHVVVVSPALDRTVAALQAAGLELRRLREEPTPSGAPRQAFFRLGEVILEVVQEPQEVLERAGGPDRPAFFWGLALCAPDLEASVAAIGEGVGTIRAAVQRGRQIATLRRSAGLALPVALISPVETAARQR